MALPLTTVVRCAVACLWAVMGAGCDRISQSSVVSPAVLLVGNALDGTISRIDPIDGRVIGDLLPGGEAPWHLAVGTSGEMLVQSASVRRGAELTYVTRGLGGWRARPLSLGPSARVPLLAGGGRYAVVAYHAGGPPAGQQWARCRIALFDLAHGRVVAAHDVCSGRDTIVALAAASDAGDGQGHPIAYLAVWRRPSSAADCGGATGAGSRVVALRPDTGAPVAAAPLTGVPGPLLLAPSTGRFGHRLYAAEALHSPEIAAPGGVATSCELAGYEEQYEGAPAWRLRELAAGTIAPGATHAVPYRVRALAVTPDGDDVFVLAGHAALVRLTPGGGLVAQFATLPDLTLGLAATDAGVYTLDAFHDRIWALDRHHGDLVQTIPTGRRPIGIVSAAAPLHGTPRPLMR